MKHLNKEKKGKYCDDTNECVQGSKSTYKNRDNWGEIRNLGCLIVIARKIHGMVKRL